MGAIDGHFLITIDLVVERERERERGERERGRERRGREREREGREKMAKRDKTSPC